MTAVPGWLGELISLVFFPDHFLPQSEKMVWEHDYPDPNLHVCAEGLSMRLLGMAWCKAVHWSVNTEFRSLQSTFQARI